MLRIDQDDIRRIAGQLDALYTALKCFVYYTELKNNHSKDENKNQCWNFIEFTLLYTLLINWNELFGLNAKGSRWKEVTLEQDQYTDILYDLGGYNYTSWSEYRREINDLCNSFISFPDPYHHRDQEYNLTGIKISLEHTHHWLHDLVANTDHILSSEESEKWPITNKNYIQDLKMEIRDVINS